jgi:type I restriction enzyme S subunit
MSEIKDIPKHWQVKKLGEVCHTTSGGTPSRQKSSYYNGNIPWVKSGELARGLILDTEEKISEEAIKNSSAKVFPKGTLLIALYGATIGKLAFLGVDAATNQAICGIFKNDTIDSNYLYHFLFYKKPNLVKQGIGGAQPNISQGILKNLDLPIPPLPEQQAIVAKIEELLSELENGKQQLLTAQQQLKVYRQSLLKWAFEGKLSKTKNIKSVKLGEVLEFVGSGVTPKGGQNVYQKHGVIFIRSQNVYPNQLALDDVAFISDEIDDRMKRTRIFANDVLLNITGASIGRTAYVPKKFPRGNVNQHVCILRSNQQILNCVFLSSYLNSPKAQSEIMNEQAGATRQGLNFQQIRNLVIPICPIEEQQHIVSELESKLTVCDKIEETITQSLQQAETLRQSILKKAFEGKLVRHTLTTGAAHREENTKSKPAPKGRKKLTTGIAHRE